MGTEKTNFDDNNLIWNWAMGEYSPPHLYHSPPSDYHSPSPDYHSPSPHEANVCVNVSYDNRVNNPGAQSLIALSHVFTFKTRVSPQRD